MHAQTVLTSFESCLDTKQEHIATLSGRFVTRALVGAFPAGSSDESAHLYLEKPGKKKSRIVIDARR